MKIIDNLGHDPRPVDGVDRAQSPGAFELRIIEQRFNDGLGVIKRTLDGKVMDVWIQNRGHLSFLNRTDTPPGMEHKNLDPFFSTQPMNRSTTRVS